MRAYPVVAAISVSLVFPLIGCSGGGPSDFSAPAVTPVPTVNVKAPDTAVAGTAFSVEWTSSDATSCTATFTPDTDTSGAALVTVTAVESVTYSVTCTGAGGSNTASATVSVGAPTAEGFWRGTTNGGRSLSGVVTKEGDYWLTYSASGSGPVIGFYAGHTTQAMTALSSGTFASSNLREVNYATGFSGGNTALGAILTGNYSAKTSLSGTLDAVSGGAFAGATGTDTAITDVPGISHATGFGQATLDANGTTLTVNWTGQVTIFNTNVLNVDFSDVLTGTIVNGAFMPTAGHTHINSCSVVSGTVTCSQVTSPPENIFTSVTGSLSIANGAAGTFTAQYTSVGGTVTNTYNVGSLNVTLSGLPSISGNDSFNLNTYDSAYEATPTLAAVTDNYTGTASAGTTQAANSTFNIAADGAINGAEGGGGCTYTGTTTIHGAGGNVYDVTLHVAVCAVQGDYSGVAIYDATNDQVIVTVLNAARDRGFMFIGNGANH